MDRRQGTRYIFDDFFSLSLSLSLFSSSSGAGWIFFFCGHHDVSPYGELAVPFLFYSIVFATTALLLHDFTFFSRRVSARVFSFSIMMEEGPLPRGRMEGITYFLA